MQKLELSLATYSCENPAGAVTGLCLPCVLLETEQDRSGKDFGYLFLYHPRQIRLPTVAQNNDLEGALGSRWLRGAVGCGYPQPGAFGHGEEIQRVLWMVSGAVGAVQSDVSVCSCCRRCSSYTERFHRFYTRKPGRYAKLA